MEIRCQERGVRVWEFLHQKKVADVDRWRFGRVKQHHWGFGRLSGGGGRRWGSLGGGGWEKEPKEVEGESESEKENDVQESRRIDINIKNTSTSEMVFVKTILEWQHSMTILWKPSWNDNHSKMFFIKSSSLKNYIFTKLSLSYILRQFLKEPSSFGHHRIRFFW